MTNEELCEAIQNGNREQITQLWEQVKGWIRAKAVSFHAAIGRERGLTVEDLQQIGFLAMLDAVDHYDQDRGVFITCLTVYLKSHFYIAAGLRTERQVRDPINSRVSIYQPADDEDSERIIDLQESPDNVIEQAEEKIYCEQLRADLLYALSQLPEQQGYVIQEHYLNGRKLSDIAAELKVTRSNLYQAENRALRSLRHDEKIRKYGADLKIRKYIDDMTPWFLRTSQSSMVSPVEVLAEMREQWRKDKMNMDKERRSSCEV